MQSKRVELENKLQKLWAQQEKINTQINNLVYELAVIANSKTCDICGATFLCPSNDGKVYGANFEELGPVVKDGKTITFVCAKCLAPMFAKEKNK